MGESHKHNVEGKKPETKKVYTQYEFMYIKL